MSILRQPSRNMLCACKKTNTIIGAVTAILWKRLTLPHVYSSVQLSSGFHSKETNKSIKMCSSSVKFFHTLRTNNRILEIGNTSYRLNMEKSYSLFNNIFWDPQRAFNQVDFDRLRLYGPDRVCAEWVLRNGGGIRWLGSQDRLPLMDYNLLPDEAKSLDYKLEEIDLSGTDVRDAGFYHLRDLKQLKSIRMRGVRTVKDRCFEFFEFVEPSLERLEIGECGKITEKGLRSLYGCRNLKQITIYKMKKISNLDDTVSKMQEEMPWCTFSTKDPYD